MGCEFDQESRSERTVDNEIRVSLYISCPVAVIVNFMTVESECRVAE